jgi:hypothetical protein
MPRTKQTNSKRIGAARKTPAGKVPRKSLGGKGIVVPTKKKHGKRPGIKLVSRKINIFADWIYSQGPSRNQKLSESLWFVDSKGTISTIGRGDLV